MVAILLLVMHAFTASLIAQNAPAITAKNWMRHPEVKKVRAIYKEVRNKIKSNLLLKRARKIYICEPPPMGGNLWRTLYTQGKKRVRLYITRRISEGVENNVEMYFDNKGVLRFIFAILSFVYGDDPEERVQYRVYYDARGKLIWENRRHVKGPKNNYAPPKWSDFQRVGNPLKDFRKIYKEC